MNPPTQPLTPQSPRLTATLQEMKHPFVCQSCGGSAVPGFGNGLLRVVTDRWQEYDHNDKPELKVVVLCGNCAKKLIAPHPRLYSKLAANAPFGGCMGICVSCRFREGVSCGHPRSKNKGGEGVRVQIKPSHKALVDGPAYHGPVEFWPEPARGCTEYAEAK